MKQVRKLVCSILTLGTVVTGPVLGASVTLDDVPLSENCAWIENGTSYMTLRTLSEQGDYILTWDGTQAQLTGDQIVLTARPGALYIEVNGRALYVEDGVQVRQGVLYLPLRVIADATGGLLVWNEEERTAHLRLMNATPALANYNTEDLEWLARVISAESRGESLTGQIAVGNVVLNRVEHKNYPNTIKEVVFDQNYGVQFEPVENGTIYDTPVPSATIAAKLCLEGANVVEDCLYFFAPELSQGTWIVNHAEYVTTIGCHQFYRE